MKRVPTSRDHNCHVQYPDYSIYFDSDKNFRVTQRDGWGEKDIQTYGGMDGGFVDWMILNLLYSNKFDPRSSMTTHILGKWVE